MGNYNESHEISDLSERLEGKRIREDTRGPEEKRMKPSDFAEYEELLNELARQLKMARHPDSLVLLQAARLSIRDHCLLLSSTSLPATQRGLADKSLEETTIGSVSEHQSAALELRPREGREIRVQEAKFKLNDIMLPKASSSINSSKNNLAKQERDSGEQQVSGSEPVCVSHEKRSTGSMTRSAKDEPASDLERAAKALKLLYLADQRQLQNQVNELIARIQSITANPKTDPRLLATGR